jgi:hypothetical protein
MTITEHQVVVGALILGTEGFAGADAQSVLDAMVATQTNGGAALTDEPPLP